MNSLIEVRDVCVHHLAGTIFVCEWSNYLILPKLSEQGKHKHLTDLYDIDFDFISGSNVVDAMFVSERGARRRYRCFVAVRYWADHCR